MQERTGSKARLLPGGQARFHRAQALALFGLDEEAGHELSMALEVLSPDDYGYWASAQLMHARQLIRRGDPDGGLEHVTVTISALTRDERVGLPTARARKVLAMLPSRLEIPKELSAMLVSPPPEAAKPAAAG